MSSYCHTCDCSVPDANLNQHAFGKKHRDNENKYHSTNNLTWCPLCDCKVPRSGFEGHVLGRHHQTNCDCGDEATQGYTPSDDDSDGMYYDGQRLDVDPSDIRYSQHNIGPCFRDEDGTTLEAGIENLENGDDYEIEVDCVDGHLVALNNRTLYCYKQAHCSRHVTVVVNLGELRRRGREVCGYSITVRHGSRY